jgi:preprotein translocase subunit SecF
MLKRSGEGGINKQIYESFKTGMTMAWTSIVAVGLAYVLTGSFSEILSQIFLILFFCLLFDMINTWITNVSVLKWYVFRRKK